MNQSVLYLAKQIQGQHRIKELEKEIAKIKKMMDNEDDMGTWFEMNGYLFDLESDKVCLLEKLQMEKEL